MKRMCLVLSLLRYVSRFDLNFCDCWVCGVVVGACVVWVEREFMCLDIRCVSGFCKLLFQSSNM
ncbi:hypothetical protein M758_UG057400 [Ceratodon purpureus]|nr:hypothetical protein M758_UG057400 [Ceratodon purpureus]